jgi:hypothetical protein
VPGYEGFNPLDESVTLTTDEQWKDDCLKAHNYFRAQYEYLALNNDTGEKEWQKLGELEWDEELAATATRYAESQRNAVRLEHSDAEYRDIKKIGETMTANSFEDRKLFRCAPGVHRYNKEYETDYLPLLEKWKEENPNTNEIYRPNKDVHTGDAHLRQILFRGTWRVGCGYGHSDAKDAEGYPKQRVEVCHYFTGYVRDSMFEIQKITFDKP